MTCVAGRLLVDTYVCSRDLLKEGEYSLASLSAKLLQQTRQELNANEVLHSRISASVQHGQHKLGSCLASQVAVRLLLRWCLVPRL